MSAVTDFLGLTGNDDGASAAAEEANRQAAAYQAALAKSQDQAKATALQGKYATNEAQKAAELATKNQGIAQQSVGNVSGGQADNAISTLAAAAQRAGSDAGAGVPGFSTSGTTQGLLNTISSQPSAATGLSSGLSGLLGTKVKTY